MQVGVLADSHSYDIDNLPKKALDELMAMDLIIHAGDYTGKNMLDELRTLTNFDGVYGNMDPPEIRDELPSTKVLDVMGLKIGVAHPLEGGAPFGLEKRVRAKFDQVDVIIYGHSHRTKNEVIHGILYFNPGSITGKLPARHKTFGVLKINTMVKGKILKV